MTLHLPIRQSVDSVCYIRSCRKKISGGCRKCIGMRTHTYSITVPVNTLHYCEGYTEA